MKRNSGITLILASFVLTTIGSVLKILHASGSDVFLAMGVISFIVGLVLLLFKLPNKKSA